MKTTNKYAAKVSESAQVSEMRPTEASPVSPSPRDIVLMRIRHILKSVQEV